MKKVMLYPNIRKKNVVSELAPICKLLQGQVEILAPVWTKEVFPSGFSVQFLSEKECIRQANFIVTLGGDGTILRVTPMAAAYDVPVLGVNFGHLGFMTDLEQQDILKLQKLIDEDYVIEERMMLDVTIFRQGKPKYHKIALNEAVVTNGLYFNKTIQIHLQADGVPVMNTRGDGVIIATPTGSTAYSLSAGGPVIEPSAENISVTPLCAHAMWASSYVFSAERMIHVEAATYEGKPAFLAVDGNEGIEILPTDVVQIKRASQRLKLIRVRGRSVYSILSEKLSDRGAAR